MQHTALPELSGSVCRYSPFWLAISFTVSFLVGIAGSLVQLVAVPGSASVALLAEALHAFTDSVLIFPAMVVSTWLLLKPSKAKAIGEILENKVASWMAKTMVVSGLLAIAFAFVHWGVPGLKLHAHEGAKPALLGLLANGVQLAVLMWCRRCRIHRLSLWHLAADTGSSVFVSLELVFELNERSGLPVDSVGGALVGVFLVWQGLRGVRSH